MNNLHIRKAGPSYQYRRRIPTRFQTILQKKTITRMIPTDCEITAAYHAKKLNIQIDKLFADLDANKPETIDIATLTIGSSTITASAPQHVQKTPITVPSIPKLQRVSQDYYDPLGIAPKVHKQTTIAQLVADYTHSQTSKNKWSKNSEIENARMFELLKDWAQDTTVEKLDRNQAKSIRDFIHKLPKNRNKHIKYKGKSIRQLAQMIVSEEDRISDRTKDKYINCFTSLLSYAMSEGLVDTNVFTGLAIGSANYSDKKHYTAFDNDELYAIFNSKKSCYQNEYTAARYFVPLLLLTGLGRVSEYTQLTVDQLVVVRDIDCISHSVEQPVLIDEKEWKKSLKTRNSTRVVPIHPRVIELGFLDYVKTLDQTPGTPIFPELAWTERGNYGALSSWFNNTYLKTLKIKSKSKVLYCLKYSAISVLDEKHVPELVLAKLAGHSYGNTESTKTYSSGKSIGVLFDAVKQIDFECLDSIPKFESNQ